MLSRIEVNKNRLPPVFRLAKREQKAREEVKITSLKIDPLVNFLTRQVKFKL
jgi:hypothetical protein